MVTTRGHDPVTTMEIERTKTMEGKPRVEWAGLTKREWLAGRAMQGILACDGIENIGLEDTSKDAVKYADALIKALNE